MADTVPCRACGAPLVWAKTKLGRRMPLDAQTTELWVVDQDGVAEMVRGHVTHWATCPRADEFRRRKGDPGA